MRAWVGAAADQTTSSVTTSMHLSRAWLGAIASSRTVRSRSRSRWFLAAIFLMMAADWLNMIPRCAEPALCTCCARSPRPHPPHPNPRPSCRQRRKAHAV